MDLFALDDYKDVLRLQIAERRDVPGYKAKTARAGGCHASFLSQVLHGPVHLTPDHAVGIAEFFQLDPLETDYFLELLAFARASSPKLRQLIKERLRRLRDSRIGAGYDQVILSDDQKTAIYFSEWRNCAIHILLGVPGLQQPSTIARHLGLEKAVVQESLSTLSRLGLALEKSPGRWERLENRIHLPKGSRFLPGFHSQWRARAVHSLDRKRSEDTHFTGVFALDSSALEKVRGLLLQVMLDSKKWVSGCQPDRLACLALDLFVESG